MRIAMMGTRGVPAHYGGFETAIEEIGRRLVERGHHVRVYCRQPEDGERIPDNYLGMELVTLPSVRSKAIETLSHTAISAAHLFKGRRFDAVFMFNSANSPFLPLLRVHRDRVAVHVDGLEWKRSKWSGAGKRYYRMAEALSVRWADALIADAQGIADYYRDEFGASTEVISYGAPIIDDPTANRLEELGLEPGRFHLVVARFEPENNVDMIVRGYKRSTARYPLIVVGSAPYSDTYVDQIRAIAEGDERIRLIGALWDQDQLDQLYSNSLLYVHGHSVGGTNPSLLRAMGAGAAVGALDVVFNREVLGDGALLFHDEATVADLVQNAEADFISMGEYGSTLREAASLRYKWDDVALKYEELAVRLSQGSSRRGEASGTRRKTPQRI